jgi:hypothetical protein
MRYENTPRPLIEDHYHIRELIERQEVRTQDRIYHQNREKALAERQALIKDNKLKDIKEFWCDRCRKDFVGEAILNVEIDWSNPAQNIAFYRTKCFCGAWALRPITDRLRDSYPFRSRRAAKERGVHFADTVQPWETGFQLLYGRKNKSR